MTKLNKNYLILITLFTTMILSEWSFGADNATPTPKYLEGGQVTIKTKAGVSVGSSDDWAVVPRKNLSKYKVCPASCGKGKTITAWKTTTKVKTVEKVVIKNPAKNRILLHAGLGYHGINIVEDDETFEVVQNQVPIMGLTYMRFIGNKISLGGSVLTNESYTANIGLDF